MQNGSSNGHRLLTRAEILAAPDLPRELVSVPEWGGSVYVRTMTGAERDALETEMFQADGTDVGVSLDSYLANFRAKLVARCVVDEDGDRLFSDTDVVALGQKSAAALQRVVAVAQRLSAITPADVEALRKNSDAPADASSSASPSPSGKR